MVELNSDTARRAKRENGGLGDDPPGSTDDLLTSPWDLEVQSRQGWSLTVTARRVKRENGRLGVSLRKEGSSEASPVAGRQDMLEVRAHFVDII